MSITIAALLIAAATVCAQETVSVWDGIYVAGQAARGKALYSDQCASCHGDGLKGKSAPALAGTTFQENWNGLTAGDLFEYVKKSMPRGAAGTLSRDQTADIVAFMLTSNGFPAGTKDLPKDAPALQAIHFVAARPK